MRRPKRDMQRPQAPQPWRRQVEANIFCGLRGWWHEAHDSARSEYERAHWRQFFGWPPPLDTARFSEIFAGMYRGEIADVVSGGNALLVLLR